MIARKEDRETHPNTAERGTRRGWATRPRGPRIMTLLICSVIVALTLISCDPVYNYSVTDESFSVKDTMPKVYEREFEGLALLVRASTIAKVVFSVSLTLKNSSLDSISYFPEQLRITSETGEYNVSLVRQINIKPQTHYTIIIPPGDVTTISFQAHRMNPDPNKKYMEIEDTLLLNLGDVLFLSKNESLNMGDAHLVLTGDI